MKKISLQSEISFSCSSLPRTSRRQDRLPSRNIICQHLQGSFLILLNEKKKTLYKLNIAIKVTNVFMEITILKPIQFNIQQWFKQFIVH